MIAAVGRQWRAAFAGPALHRLTAMAGSRALAALLGFAATARVARALDPAVLGLWSMALAMQGLALQAGEAGLRSVVTGEAAREPAARDVLLRRYLVLRLAIATGVIALASLMALVAVPESWLLVTVLLTTLWPIALQLDWLALSLGYHRQAGFLLLVRPAAFLVLVLAVPWGDDTLGLAFLLVAAWWVAAAASWPCLASSVPSGRAALVPGSPALLRLGLPLAAVSLSSQMLIGLDLLLVGARLGADEAALYFLAGAILTAGLAAANGIGQAGLARFAACMGDAGSCRRAIAADLVMLGTIALAGSLALVLLAPVLVPWIFGPAHAGAVPLVLWLLPWFVGQHATTVLTAALTAARQGDRLLMVNLGMLIALLPALATAWAAGDIRLFALARGLAEIVRVALIYRSLPQALRPFG